MAESIPDAVIRTAAFEHVRGLRDAHGELTSTQLAAGFQFRGARIPLIKPQRGIFAKRRFAAMIPNSNCAITRLKLHAHHRRRHPG